MRNIVCVLMFTLVTAIVAEEGNSLFVADDCQGKPFFPCLKQRAIQFIDSHQGDIQLTDSVKLIRTVDSSLRGALDNASVSNDTETPEHDDDIKLVKRIARFVGSHALQLRVPKESTTELQRSSEDGRRKKKAKRILMPLLLLLKLKAATLLPIALSFLALLAAKALFVGKLALVISGLIGLKKFWEGKNSNQNYEVVTYPQHSIYDEHGSHYARSLHGNSLAYIAQIKP